MQLSGPPSGNRPGASGCPPIPDADCRTARISGLCQKPNRPSTDCQLGCCICDALGTGTWRRRLWHSANGHPAIASECRWRQTPVPKTQTEAVPPPQLLKRRHEAGLTASEDDAQPEPNSAPQTRVSTPHANGPQLQHAVGEIQHTGSIFGEAREYRLGWDVLRWQSRAVRRPTNVSDATLTILLP